MVRNQKKVFAFHLENDLHKILTTSSKVTHKSMGHLINYAIRNTFGDPLVVIRKEKKELAQRMAALDEREDKIIKSIKEREHIESTN